MANKFQVADERSKFQDWYERNKVRFNRRRRARYKRDAAYRERAKANSAAHRPAREAA